MEKYVSNNQHNKFEQKCAAYRHKSFFHVVMRKCVSISSMSLVTLLLLGYPILAQAHDKIRVGFLVGVSGLGDHSYNDMTYAGLFKIKKEYDIHIIFEDSEKSDLAFEGSMQRLIEKGSNIIVANGFYLKELVEKYAKLHPEINFILQDAIATDHKNVVSIVYSVDEGSFLAGAFAGLMSNSSHVGFIGGVDIPIMHVFRLGFTHGVKHINPMVAVKEQFISIAPDYSGFKKPSEAHKIAMDFYNSGVDIIFSAAGLSGNGVLQAAKEKGQFAIGVDTDQDHLAKGHVLTSMMKRLDIATYTEVKKIIHGNSNHGVVTYGLAENGVGLSPMNFTKHLVPESVITRINQIKQDIISGRITIPES